MEFTRIQSGIGLMGVNGIMVTGILDNQAVMVNVCALEEGELNKLNGMTWNVLPPTILFVRSSLIQQLILILPKRLEVIFIIGNIFLSDLIL